MLTVKIVALSVLLSAGGPALAEEVERPTTTPSGTIILYRGQSVWGAGLGCPIRSKGREVVELARGKFARWSVKPGRYILTNKTASVEVNVEAGETRYVRCMIKSGFLTGRADLQIVDETDFQVHAKEFDEKSVSPDL